MAFAETAGGSGSARAADHRRRFGAGLVAALLAAAALPTVAGAQDFAPGDPALDEYVESLPIAEGHRPPGGRAHKTPLPAATRRALTNSAGGELLVGLAESSSLGAPTRSSRRQRGESGRRDRPADVPGAKVRARAPAGGSLASAAAESAFGGGSGLILVLLLLSVTAAALLGRRRRRSG